MITVNHTVVLFTAANEPQDISAGQRNSTEIQVNVSWSAPASGATVTGYVIYYETTGGSEQSVTVVAAATEYTLKNCLMNGRTYSISIVALSAHLPSIQTDPVSVTVGQLLPAHAYTHCLVIVLSYPLAESPIPMSPANLTSPSQSPTSITLSWEQPAGDAVDIYDIAYTYQGGCSDYTQPENMATVNDGTARAYTLQNLQEFSSYMISVAAVNELGASAPAVKLIATLTGTYGTLSQC